MSLEVFLRLYSIWRNIYSAKSTKYVRPVRVSGTWIIALSPCLSLLTMLDGSSTPGQCGQEDQTAISPCCQSRGVVFYEEQEANISNHLQLQVTEAKFLVSASMRLGTPLFQAVPTRRVEASLSMVV